LTLTFKRFFIESHNVLSAVWVFRVDISFKQFGLQPASLNGGLSLNRLNVG